MRATRQEIELAQRETEAYRRQSDAGWAEARGMLRRAETAEEWVRKLRKAVSALVCSRDQHGPECGCDCWSCKERDAALKGG